MRSRRDSCPWLASTEENFVRALTLGSQGCLSLRLRSAWGELPGWLLRAIKVAIKSTVEIADDDWFADIDSILELGKKQIAESKTATELFAYLSATLARLVFLQIGFSPLGRQQKETIPLTKEWWTLTSVRTVQFVQNNKQCHTAQVLRDRRIRP
jgi:hypothetical protein